MKIRNKIAFPLSAVLLATMLVLLVLIYTFFSKFLKEDIKAELNSVLLTDQASIVLFYDDMKSDFENLTLSPSIKRIFSENTGKNIEIAKKSIQDRAKEVAEEVNQYILAHPDKTVEDLQADLEFREIAIRPVGEEGYTALTDVNSLVARFHTNPDIENLSLSTLSESLPEFWDIMKSTRNGFVADGFYEWRDAGGQIREKYMYIDIVDSPTADNVVFSVAATAYLYEYNSSLKVLYEADNYLKSYTKSSALSAMSLVSFEGVVLWDDKDSSLVGINIYNDPNLNNSIFFNTFQQAIKTKDSLSSDFVEDDNGNTVSYFAVPVYIKDKLGGVIVTAVDNSRLNKIVQRKESVWNSLDTYLVGTDYSLRTISTKYVGQDVLNTHIQNKNTIACFNQKQIGQDLSVQQENALFTYSNLGENWYGTHYYIPDLEWCLVAEVSKAEVDMLLRDFILYVSFLFVLVIILVILVLYYLTNTIFKSIRQLQYAVKKISGGDLDYKIELSGADEIVDLAKSFKEMTNSLKKSRKNIEKKVKQQTKKIVESETELRDQQKAILNILEDVDEERVIFKKQRDRIAAILQSIGDGVLVIDNEGFIQIVNPVACKLVNCDEKDLLGKKYNTVYKFYDETTDELLDDFIDEAIKSGEIKNMPFGAVLRRKGEKDLPVGDSAAPIRNEKGEIVGCVVVFRDTSIEREVDKAKTEFVSLASHQLRTPLSTIRWYVEMLATDEVKNLSNSQKEYVSEIERGNIRMINLVNALLNVSRLELGTFSIEPKKVKLEPIIKSVIKELKPKIKEKDLHITRNLSKLGAISVDKDLFIIIVQNLLTNAVKYTPKGGSVAVSLSKDKNKIVFSVKDSGYGIPKKDQKHIFEKMFRADNVKEKDTTGTGLGLYMVKKILESVGGEIWFESGKNKGSTFYVSIPASGMKGKKGTKKLEKK
ncbi:MAG: HAMP domain-containing protein [Candidatus Magasanikbacteria bacterium]|nr:HAMP domain-containing protein [Candidatus Magasanikbacteria bacterium]